MAEIHKYLTDFNKYKTEVPFYVDNLFTDAESKQLMDVIYKNKNMLDPVLHKPNEQTSEKNWDRFRPKTIEYMSRVLVEFQMPKNLEEKLDNIAKPIYDGEVALCHYNYIEYNKKYGNGNNSPKLPPHIDADENLITINHCVDGNIEWDLYIGNQEDGTTFTRYTLEPGQTIVFSAVNQVHWRPKRKFKDGEFLEIVSMDYCPITNYRFTGEMNPLDAYTYPEKRSAYTNSLNHLPEFKAAWTLYHQDGMKDGIIGDDF
jgi:hypothetical protein